MNAVSRFLRRLSLTLGRSKESQVRLLKMHIRGSDKAVAIFTPAFKPEYTNPRFAQYVSAILGHPLGDVSEVWDNEFFAPLRKFKKENSDCRKYDSFSFDGEAGGKVYRVRLLVYPETGFELSIADITRGENASRLKQQMTSNISHELRTPVTSIMGYLETLEACPSMPEEKRKAFIHRAYTQTVRLSDLIRDMAIISKIEESPEKLPRLRVNLRAVAEEVFSEFSSRIEAQNDTVENLIPEGLTVEGNESLLYAIFRNLVENSLKYAGEGVKLHLECYANGREGGFQTDPDDGPYVFLTYYDTGNGVSEEHLSRLFERFYRIGEGRSREDGGSGLGLSIVRNAVSFHGGDIRAVNRTPSGLQFFFSLRQRA